VAVVGVGGAGAGMGRERMGSGVGDDVRDREQPVLVDLERVVAEVEAAERRPEVSGGALGLLVPDPLHVVYGLVWLLPELAALPALAVGERDHLGGAAGARAQGDRAAGPPDEVGRMRADDEQLPAHERCSPATPTAASTPASRRVFVTAIVRTSSAVKPASRWTSAIRASPSSTGGLASWPRSVAQTVRSTPTARVASNTRDQVVFPVYAVVKTRSITAPSSASSTWSDGSSDCDGNSGC